MKFLLSVVAVVMMSACAHNSHSGSAGGDCPNCKMAEQAQECSHCKGESKGEKCAHDQKDKAEKCKGGCSH